MLHNHTQPAGIILANESTQYHWRFCMAGYHCLMPIGILFMLTAPIFNFSSLIFHLDAAGIISHKTLHDVIWIIINPRFIQYAD